MPDHTEIVTPWDEEREELRVRSAQGMDADLDARYRLATAKQHGYRVGYEAALAAQAQEGAWTREGLARKVLTHPRLHSMGQALELADAILARPLPASQEAIVKMAVLRRGVEEEFFATSAHGTYHDGDTWAGEKGDPRMSTHDKTSAAWWGIVAANAAVVTALHRYYGGTPV